MNDVICGRVTGVRNTNIVGHMRCHDVYQLIINKTFDGIDKINRPLIYASYSAQRPTKDSFDDWSGLQIFDLDIHDSGISKVIITSLHDFLKRFKWYALCSLSTSLKGIHIYTGIDVSNIESTEERKKIYYNSYYNKVVIIYNILTKLFEKYLLNIKPEDVIDNHMMSVSQGVFLSATEHAFYNDKFQLESFNEKVNLSNNVLGLKTRIVQILNAEDNDDVLNIDDIDAGELPTNIHRPIHYKYQQRWSIINTLVAVYGEQKTKQMLPHIFAGTPTAELVSIIRTAKSRKKAVSTMGIELLNTNHGFNITYTGEIRKNGIRKEIDDAGEIITQELTKPQENAKNHFIKLKHNEFLLDKKDEIMSIIKSSPNDKDSGNIVILESGTGTGKTHFFSNLDGKVLLIEPFISVIESNFDNTEWECVYGSKRPQYKKNIVMTFDKFSRIELVKLIEEKYEYIIIDESHLLLSSPYRPILGNVLKVLAQLVEWNKDLTNPFNIVLMSGTPFGERIFFNNLYDKYIKIEKETQFKKVANIFFDTDISSIITKTVIDSVKQIRDGGTVLMPCNQGEKFVKTIERAIDWYGSSLYDDWKPIKSLTYRKSTSNVQKCMDLIESEDATVYDFISCTTYMSVGVNITKFKRVIPPLIIFNNINNDFYNGNDIEQFANRLRQSDLHVNVNFKVDSINTSLFQTVGLSLNTDTQYLEWLEAMTQTTNKYNGTDYLQTYEANKILQSPLIEYNLVDEKWNINREFLLLQSFYEDYSKYIGQFSVIIKFLRYYNYQVEVFNINNFPNIVETIPLIATNFMEIRRMIKSEFGIIYEAYLDFIADNFLRVKETVHNDMVVEEENDLEIISFADNNVLYVKNRKEFDYIFNIFNKYTKFFKIDTIMYIFNNCRANDGQISWTKIENVYDNVQYIFKEDEKIVTGMQGQLQEHIGMDVNNVKEDITPVLDSIVDNYMKEASISFIAENKLRTKYKKLITNIYHVFFYIDEENHLAYRNYYNEFINIQKERDNDDNDFISIASKMFE